MSALRVMLACSAVSRMIGTLWDLASVRRPGWEGVGVCQQRDLQRLLRSSAALKMSRSLISGFHKELISRTVWTPQLIQWIEVKDSLSRHFIDKLETQSLIFAQYKLLQKVLHHFENNYL